MDEVPERIDELKAEGVEAVAVSFLHSYQNPEPERQVGQILAITRRISSFHSRVMSCPNTGVRAHVDHDRERLCPAGRRGVPRSVGRSLRDLGVTAPFYVMISSGGLSTVETARRFPIRLVESGPAAGALAAAYHGKESGRSSLLSFDMGGTTAKACLIDDNRPSISPSSRSTGSTGSRRAAGCRSACR